MQLLIGGTSALVAVLAYGVLSLIATVGALVGALGVVTVGLVAYRLLTRRCVLYDDRSLLVRGFWCSMRVQAADVTGVVLRRGDFITEAWAGHRIYVCLAAEGRTLTVCVASCTGLRQTRSDAEAFTNEMSVYSAGRPISLNEQSSFARPDGSGGLALVAGRLRHSIRQRRRTGR